MKRIEDADGSDSVMAMRKIAELSLPYGVDSDEDLETLVEAFSTEARTLGILGSLAEMTVSTDDELTR